MKSPLNILHVEDDPHDATLIRSTLEAANIPCAMRCVQTRSDFIGALEEGGVDLILSDFSLPTFDGLTAMETASSRWPRIPFILVSGTLGEELAIDSLKKGATDYVLKGRLSRLAPAVTRAMQEVEEHEERLRLESQFIEAQKAQVIGQLASGVAHDFNNILAVIMGCNELIGSELGTESPLQKFVDEIRHASDRAAGLTRQLLIFIRKQTVLPVVLNLNDAVKELDQMLRRLLDENIDMTIVYGDSLGHINADSGYVGQVLMNLVVNARDAMPNGGKLTVSTSNITLDEHSVDTPVKATPGDYVMVSVCDTGTGMTEEVKARLFEAFFTTKPVGKGTGLGLATCQTIVQQSGGFIGVSTQLDEGTTFTIYFPRVEQPVHSLSVATQGGPLPRGTETLMVVEDEPTVRHMAADVLESHGYTVLRAPNGQEGLHQAQAHEGASIELVITDVVMPMMGGIVMAEWLKETYPNLKILFTSGYTEEEIDTEGVLGSGVEFLPKPYAPAVLIRKVRQMLDA